MTLFGDSERNRIRETCWCGRVSYPVDRVLAQHRPRCIWTLPTILNLHVSSRWDSILRTARRSAVARLIVAMVETGRAGNLGVGIEWKWRDNKRGDFEARLSM